MRAKLKLNLEDLSVDSFGTSDQKAEAGTVFAEQCTCWTNCTCPGCPSCDTCQASCNGTCPGQASCGQSCGYTCANTCWESCNFWDCPGETPMYSQCGDMMCQ
jgi:hypothetical protein